MEVGIDIEQNERFKNVSQRVIDKAFTKSEIEYAEKHINKHEILCSFWCVKEAVVKALSNRALNFQQINIKATPEGRPYIEKNEYVINELKKLGMSEIKISISHAKDYSTAICIVYWFYKNKKLGDCLAFSYFLLIVTLLNLSVLSKFLLYGVNHFFNCSAALLLWETAFFSAAVASPKVLWRSADKKIQS